MKSFTPLLFFVAASLANVSGAEMVKAPVRDFTSMPQISIPLCDTCLAPGCSTAQFDTEVTLKETKSLSDDLPIRSFSTETDSKGVAKLSIGFTDVAKTKKTAPSGIITNRLETDVVMTVDVKLSLDASKQGQTMTTGGETVAVKVPAGKTCSAPLPKGYGLKDISQVMAFMDDED